MRGFLTSKVIVAAALVGSLLLYLAGIEFALVLACLVAGVYLLPAVPVMRSLVGRLFAAALLFFAVFQAAATVQFLALPGSDFRTAAAVTAGIYLVAVLLTDLQTISLRGGTRGLVSRYDGAAAIVAAIFLVPFAPILLGDDSVARVAQIGGGQASDGATHVAMIAQMGYQQHLDYAVGQYYPQGFHITLAFLQDSFGISPADAGWTQGVLLYFGQYLFFGVMLAGAIGYFLSAGLAALGRRSALTGGTLLLAGASVATGVVVTVFLLLPFVSNGFLNYYYALATILVAFAYLLVDSPDRLYRSAGLYLVFIFGAGLSWPLLLPPLLGSLFIFLCRGSFLRALVALPKLQLAVLAALFGLQFIPVVFQLLYSDKGTGETINLLGSLRVFHPLSLLLSAALVAGIAVGSRAHRALKESSVAILLPLLAFTGLLALMQLFMTGEVRYYVIKVAFLLEALNIVFLSCLAAVVLSRIDLSGVVKFVAVAVLPAAVVFSLFAVVADPLVDVRNLFRTEAGQVKPVFFDEDLDLYAALGDAGEVSDFNSTLLHYDSENDRYFGHMQISFWAQMMQYDATAPQYEAMACNAALYKNLAFGTATEVEQATLLLGIRECVDDAQAMGRQYIIVTDSGSVDAIRAEFGDLVRIETNEH